MEVINTGKAPTAIGPYSQAIKSVNMIFTSGQIPINPADGQLVKGSIEDQAKQVLENLGEVLKAAGADYCNVVKTTVFLKDMNDFITVNNIYAQYFKAPFPARSCVEVSRLPKDVSVEIEAMAII